MWPRIQIKPSRLIVQAPEVSQRFYWVSKYQKIMAVKLATSRIDFVCGEPMVSDKNRIMQIEHILTPCDPVIPREANYPNVTVIRGVGNESGIRRSLLLSMILSVQLAFLPSFLPSILSATLPSLLYR